MALSKDELGRLNEGQLHQLLKRLFEAMDYRDVRIFHGPGEQGKDLVMWKFDKHVGVRKNIAVNVKARKLSGSVTSPSGPGGLIAQVNQCFAASYADPVSGEDRTVDECWIVTSQSTEGDAVERVKNALGGNVDKVVFIDGDKVWEWVEEYLGPASVPPRISEVVGKLEALDPDWRVTVDTTGGVPSYSLEPKHQEAEDIQVHTSFQFPDTPEGEAAREELEEHVRRGVPVRVQSEFVADVDLPDFLRRLIDPTGDADFGVEFGPRQGRKEVRTRFVTIGRGGEETSLEPVLLRPVRVGTEEWTLRNDDQNVPFEVEVVLRPNANEGRVRYSLQLEGTNVRRALELTEFLQAASASQQCRIEDIESGLDLLHVETGNPSGEAPDGFWTQFLEKALMIQEETGTRLDIPEGGFAQEHVDVILDTAAAIETGTAKVSESGSVLLEQDADQLTQMINDYRANETPRVRLKADIQQEILGQTLDLGPATLVWDAQPLTEAELTELEERADSLAEDETVVRELVIPEGTEVRYERWG